MDGSFMLKRRHLFSFLVLVFLGLVEAGPVYAEKTVSGYGKQESGLYRDVFDQAVYYEGTEALHLERFYRSLFGLRERARNVNAFDEVPDSTFFVNRHGREAMSVEALQKGPAVTTGPDSGAPWRITKGKFEGMTPGFFIRDAKGDRYLLKFDPLDNLEMATGAEVAASRFMHAMGYFVPQYTIAEFKREQLAIEPGARVYDESGFQKELTPERLEEFLLFVPETDRGSYRASASRILEGEILGPMKFQGRRRNDPDDPYRHEDRREIRALRVFSSWLNNTDLRESNSLDVVQARDGEKKIWHYLIDFGSSFGAAAEGPKAPMIGHVYLLDYGDIVKGILSLGFWEKPWQKRWREAGEEAGRPSVGYFDNRNFKPGRFKNQLPHYGFKDLTRADGFWAAKILMRFSDEEIRQVVETGEFSDKEAEKELVQTLIERRDLIGKFWFKVANPLDDFRLFQEDGGGYRLQFEDLGVRHGLAPAEGTRYQFEVIARKGNRAIRVAQKEISERDFEVESEWLRNDPALDLLIRSRRPEEKIWSPFVLIQIRTEGGTSRLARILHQD